jgi:hypothetical protein
MLPALRFALVSITAVLLSFGLTYGLCLALGVNASPAILAAALTVRLVREDSLPAPRTLLGEFLTLPLVVAAAGLVGLAFLKLPVLGAALFTAGITLSLLLRRHGESGRALGRVIALPLIAVLVMPPVHLEGAHGPLVLPLLVIAAGLIALAAALSVSWLALRLGLMTPPAAHRPTPVPATRPGTLHITTRMGLQMCAALTLAFLIGMIFFPAHWFWIVLTAFIVCSGSVGRGDAVYKGLLRLAGAIGGVCVAALAAYLVFPDPAAYAAALFSVLFLGIWLRQLNYAWWPACTTLIFALLQGGHADGVAPLLAMRLVCIVIGALCGIAAVWFICPVRTGQLVKKQVAEALAALRAYMTEDEAGEGRRAVLEHHAERLERIAAPLRLHRRLFGARQPERHPATWIELMHRLLAEASSADHDRTALGAGMSRLGAMLKADSEAGT